MFLLRDKLITQGEKRETSTKTSNETLLRDKLRGFVSRISPPLTKYKLLVVWFSIMKKVLDVSVSPLAKKGYVFYLKVDLDLTIIL